ncbi:DNA mismatch repair endonuclease MutL [Roseivirga pacifica]|uniref:DNA mismatch repair endonuclease MutL n=1 Tax=Roseivirga pacifica TaxID=1267423 RepID=UPI002095A300|nr:DNA mismatch repair endonuclease MutL [Roseivirga pacifica]MCO6359589.1 DNA mismatch repair endonuclease MutL [Roseivirga pacifica]MCO6366959.1 DNA mismatch repair endonuclease MutL [Roseivirga pacifica]MCO6370509.1 DNA mismatch repair endonuclease MutL [Roseivirga pacifica]MCO6374616.1 DNA mismatch repair endonuclease MutL [Roseivirga pacifica]MCO6379874.1 DNA mismatch repair endonuclease MutL [Roseivirga pacifica]
MPDIIKLLPDNIANQIAAGEVVQRPASVVKELLENAIDAGATDIKLIVKDSGKTLIQVVDNGKGMSLTDARMCFERHATSKIQSTDDLFNIRTMGFRGEAMASIAAVAQVELKSRREEDELGVGINIEASDVKNQEPVSTPIGTSICVKNLFFNVPARRNFLKSNAVEMRHIVDEFHHVALAYPDIAMSLYQNDLEMYLLPSAKLSKRIVGIFGRKYQDQMAPCEEVTDVLRVWGYVGKPEHAKKTRGEQFFFANNRFIKSGYLHHAVMTAFEGLLQEGTFPFYTLFIEIDPKHIDINVHPTKTEIKFDDERTVYAIIKAAVRQALGTHNIAPAIDFSQDVNFASFRPEVKPEVKQTQAQADRAYGQFKTVETRQSAGNWEKLYEGLQKELKQEEVRNSQMEIHPEAAKTITMSSAVSGTSSASETSQLPKQEPIKKGYFQIHQKYIATQVKSGLMLIDQHRAHERILFERFQTQLSNRSGACQQSLFPQTLELNPADFALVQDMAEELNAIGFKFSPFGNSALIIEGVPADLKAANEKALFEGFIEQFKHFQHTLSISTDERIARAIAQRSAIKSGIGLTQEEMSSLIDQLFACKSPGYAPDGTKTTHILELEKIDQLFN